MVTLELDPYAAVLVQEKMEEEMNDPAAGPTDRVIASLVYDECERALRSEVPEYSV